MIHARQDYMRIQDPENKIAEDEPVFLLRAKDAIAPHAVRRWAGLCFDESNVTLANIAFDWVDRMEVWGDLNHSKLPDMPMNEENITK